MSFGIFLAALPAYHGLVEEESLWRMFFGVVPPFFIGLGIAAAGLWLRGSGLDSESSLMVAAWTALASFVLAFGAALFVVHQRVRGVAVYDAGFMVTNTAAGGAALGLLVGIYDARSKKSEERYRAIFENSADAISIVDDSGTIKSWNRGCEEIFGYTAEEVVGRGFETIVPERRMERARHVFDLVDEQGAVRGYQTRRKRKDGTLVDVELTLSSLGEFGYTAIYRDITERKNYEESLREVNEELRDNMRRLEVLDRVLRHNMHNDMNVIQGYSEVLAERLSGEEEDYVESIREAAEDLLDTTDKEREIVEIVTEGRERDDVDLADVVEQVAGNAASEHPGAEVSTELPGEIVVRAIPRMYRAIEELVYNAVEHNDRETPRVEVSIQGEDGKAVLEVADNGPGIPADEVGVLTGEREIDPLYHGSGMGLWLVNWVVKISGGTVEFREREPRGSVVTVRLERVRG